MMRQFTGKRLVAALFASAGVAALAAGSAQAGGFGSRLGSADAAGQVWSGSAAPGLGIGGISVNPAVVTSVDGVNFEAGAAGVFPDGRLSTPTFSATSAVPAVAAGTAASATALGGPTGQFGTSVLAGGTYFNAQLSKDWYVGVSVTSPYGLGVNYGNTNGLSPDRSRARITTVDVQPVIGYKINDQLSIGFGAQFQWINLTFEQSLGLGSPGIGQVTGQDVGVGFSAGLTYEPFKGTKLGIGYRSSIDQRATATQSFSTALNVPLNGGFVRLPGTPGSFFVTIDQTLPETVTASIRQEFSDRLAVSLTGEWTNWRRVKTLVLGGSPTGTNLPLNFKDGWFVSGGIEYKVDPQWTLRGGVGYDFSPVTDQTRTLSVPDSNRLIFGAGIDYQWSKQISLAAAYTVEIFDRAPINRSIASAANVGGAAVPVTLSYSTRTDLTAHIISGSFVYHFAPPPAPVEQPFVTK